MLLDTKDLADKSTLECDICIVGAGAAGIAMALQFIGRGEQVLLLESGGSTAEAATQSLYLGSVVDEKLHSPPIRYRQRVLGGTTSIWGGRCMPFDDVDFEARPYVPHSGWPITAADLLPLYPAANRLCEAGEYSYLASQAFHRQLTPMLAGFNEKHFTTDTLERFSCPTDFGRRYLHKLTAARNVRLVLHANVTKLSLDEAGTRIQRLTASNLQHQEFTVNARRYVLATGGLEVARLLLANRDVHSTGIGNRHDVVGRYYMCHMAGSIGRISVNGPLDRVHHGYDISDEGIYCRRRIALRPEVQRREGLGNFVARLHHPRITDPAHRNAVLSLLYLSKFLIPYEYGKRLHGEENVTLKNWVKHFGNVLAGPLDAAGFAVHMLRDRKLAERKFPSIIIKPKVNLYSLDFHAEQQPNASSRVSLGDDSDTFGVPRLRVDWRYNRADVDTVGRTLELLADDFRTSGMGAFDYDPESVEHEVTRYGAFGGHHVGTARMGTDPHSSVVDANCKVHAVENLYVSSSATFPTSSQANPTLTIVAMALRLAGHLQRHAA